MAGRMNAIALIGFLLCTVAVVRVTLARAETGTGATPASAKELTRLRLHVNQVRTNKCLRAIPIVARAASLPPRWRAVVFRRWQVRHRASHSASKTCAPPVGHLTGWSCITNGAYPGAPHEGNGVNGPYSGPLGMTTPWMGHYPTGGSWTRMPVRAVYAIAERVAARYGFSYSFMRGQWPMTFPPCAHHF